jgi:SET domain
LHEPKSTLFEVRTTPYSGLGVYASQRIPKDTLLLKTDCVPISVILRQYRREVCAQCFAYERGRNLKIRDANTNFSFCSVTCLSDWSSQASGPEKQAWVAIEAFIRSKAGKAGRIAINSSVATQDGDGDTVLEDDPRRPTPDEINTFWDSVESTAYFIRQARNGSKTKPHVRAVNAALDILPDADVLYFLLAGVLCHYKGVHSTNDQDKTSWQSVLALSPDATPYYSSDSLHRHAYSYLQLLALCPVALLDSVTAQVCREAAARDAQNAFGIRSLEDEGSEFFGWAVWPAASYFNHSCSPSVSKKRHATTWTFSAGRDIDVGEELYISYLGGEEALLNRAERNKELKIWAFVCACVKCNGEESREMSV